jgi:hypothetical protein
MLLSTLKLRPQDSTGQANADRRRTLVSQMVYDFCLRTFFSSVAVEMNLQGYVRKKFEESGEYKPTLRLLGRLNPFPQ